MSLFALAQARRAGIFRREGRRNLTFRRAAAKMIPTNVLHGGGACVERAKLSDIEQPRNPHSRPLAATRRRDAALVEPL
jgi:hypothetical protein